jgi:hypothetical protein
VLRRLSPPRTMLLRVVTLAAIAWMRFMRVSPLVWFRAANRYGSDWEIHEGNTVWTANSTVTGITGASLTSDSGSDPKT